MSDQTNLPQHSASPNMPPEETQPHTPAIASRADTTSEGNPTTPVPAATEADVAHQSQKPAAGSASPHQEHPAVLADEQRPADPQAADDLMTRRLPGHEAADAAVLAASRTHTRRSFLVAGIATAGAYGFYRYLNISTHDEGMQPPILRNTLPLQRPQSSRNVPRHPRPSRPPTPSAARKNLRYQRASFGPQARDLVPQSWRLQLVGMQNGLPSIPNTCRTSRPGNLPVQKKKKVPTRDQGHEQQNRSQQADRPKKMGHRPPIAGQGQKHGTKTRTTDSKNGSQNDGRAKTTNNVDKDDNGRQG